MYLDTKNFKELISYMNERDNCKGDTLPEHDQVCSDLSGHYVKVI